MKKILYLVSGAVIMGIGQGCFLIPNKIAAGGISGIATLVEFTLRIKPSITVLALNIPLFIVAYKILGKRFMIFSGLGTLIFSLSLELSNFYIFSGEIILAAITGGLLTGVGLGLVLTGEATTGGTDIIARILKIYYPHLSAGKLILLVDGIIILLSIVVFKNFEIAIYAGISLYISTVFIDKILDGIDFAKAVYIISKDSKMISDNIIKRMQRGVTGLCGRGMYTNKDINMLMCVVKGYELASLKNCIYEVDKNAFIIISDVSEVVGEGFKIF